MSEDNQRRGSVKDKAYKRPASTLVVIYTRDTKRVLMPQRRDSPDFWQSVTGNVEGGETAPQATMREVKEEVTIDVVAEQPTLIDRQRTAEFEISSHLRHRYVSGVTHNTESRFRFALPHEWQIVFTEYLAHKWLDAPTAVVFTKSWSNRQAIEQFIINTA